MDTRAGPPVFRARKYLPGQAADRDAQCRKIRPDVALKVIEPRTPVVLPVYGGRRQADDSYEVGPLVIVELRNGAVFRDGAFIFTERNEILRESVDRRRTIAALASARDILAELEAAPNDADTTPVVVLGCQRSENYFHWWIDVLAKCWILDKLEYPPRRMVVPQLKHEFQRESLELLNLSVESLTTPVQRFTRVLFVHGLAPGSAEALSPSVAEFSDWCRRRLRLVEGAPYRKLFISRKGARGRRLVNEDEVLAALDSDFERVELESLGVADQIRLFAQAEVIVGPHGAGLANLLFASASARVVELVHEDSPPATYWQLARLLGQSYIGVACAPGESQRRADRRDLIADPGVVASAVHDIFN